MGATGPAAAGGAAGAGGLADPVGERARRAEQFRQDLAAGSPAARTGPGAGAVPGGGWYGSGGRPGAGGAAANAGRLPGGWNPSGPEGSSPLTGGIGARPGNGAVGSRSGGGPGGWAPGGPGGVGDPSRLPGESGSRSWSRAPGVPVEGSLARPVAGEPVTGRGAGYGPGYAPMMGGAGGLRSDGDAHRNRYLLPTSEPFDVDLPHAPPVLAPEEDG